MRLFYSDAVFTPVRCHSYLTIMTENGSQDRIDQMIVVAERQYLLFSEAGFTLQRRSFYSKKKPLLLY